MRRSSRSCRPRRRRWRARGRPPGWRPRPARQLRRLWPRAHPPTSRRSSLLTETEHGGLLNGVGATQPPAIARPAVRVGCTLGRACATPSVCRRPGLLYLLLLVLRLVLQPPSLSHSRFPVFIPSLSALLIAARNVLPRHSCLWMRFPTVLDLPLVCCYVPLASLLTQPLPPQRACLCIPTLQHASLDHSEGGKLRSSRGEKIRSVSGRWEMSTAEHCRVREGGANTSKLRPAA